MIDAALSAILISTFSYGACGCAAAVVVRVINRKKPGPGIDQAAAIGFLVGACFGALFGIFESMMSRT